MNIKVNFEEFKSQKTLQNEVYNVLISALPRLLESIKSFDGKVLNKRIEKLFPQDNDFHYRLKDVGFGDTYRPIVELHVKDFKYFKGFLLSTFEVELCTNKENGRFDYISTCEVFDKTAESYHQKIVDNENGIKNYLQCMEEFKHIKQMYADWNNKYGFVERDFNYMTFHETNY